jgi:hypothetical protein
VKFYVVIKLYSHGPEAECLGLFRSYEDAVEAVESDDEIWNPDMRSEEENFWANEEVSCQIEEHEVQ